MKQEMNIRKLSREERGKLIFERGRIAKKNDFWVIGSQTSFKAYKVRLNKENPVCSCPDCELRKKKCKHIYAVEYYVKKQIDEEGNIYDCLRNYDYDFLEDTGIKVKVKIRQNDVYCKVWKVDCFGNTELYLLDTDIEENDDRWITGRLYGGFAEERIAQEMVLGIGGVRVLRALNIPVDIYHFNEGHAVLAGLELMNEKINAGMSFDKAWESTRKEVVFTTHTPIKAGNENHSIRFFSRTNESYWWDTI